MKKQWKRLLIAALTSTAVFLLTWHWYHQGEEKFQRDENEKPLAYIGKVVEDIQRRPATRLLWQLVNTGEPLYNGEAIRTSSLGEVRILFADSDRYLDLEPDSLIVIKKTENAIALDLMEGSLFVNASTTTPEATGLVLNSAEGTVDLSKAAVTLSKGQGQNVEVQVLKGEASVQKSDGTKKSVQSTSQINVLSPPLQKPFFVNGEDIRPVSFRWQGVPTTAAVELWVGSSRKNLTLLQTGSVGDQQAEALLKLGKHYWKLTAKENNQVLAETPIYRVEVAPRYPPTVIYPIAEANLPAYAEKSEVTFRWQKGKEPQDVQLKIGADPEFKNIILDHSFKTEESFIARNLLQGTYYWQITSIYADSETPIKGKIQKLTISPAEQLKAQLAKTLKVQFTMKDLAQQFIEKPQMLLQWTSDSLTEVSGWRLRVHEEGTPEEQGQLFEVPDLKFTVPVSRPGRYIASVEALNKQGYVIGSSTSEPIQLDMKPLPETPNFVPAEGPLQAEADGRVQLTWSLVPNAKQYQLRILKNGQELRSTVYKTTQTALKNLLPGQYDLELISIDMHGRSCADIEKRTLLVPDLSNVRAPAVKRIKVD